ncbi:MAG TPA: hypothetical protein VN363_03250 [Anaerolineales bacterium]|nr:hypothetical protein [Anaerolineales bacterium]
MTDSQLLLIVATLALVIGAAIGSLISSLRNTSSQKSPQRPPEKNKPALLQVWRDQTRGRLIVGIKGEQAKAVSELSPDTLEILHKTLVELGAWVGIQPEAAPAPAATPLAEPEKELSSLLSPVNESKAARLGPVDLFARAIRADVHKPEPPAASIAAQIDAILQEKLAADPTITRAVRLLEIPAKGMVVMVGLDQYAGVDEVPDPTVRALIHEAVEEWERRTGM